MYNSISISCHLFQRKRFVLSVTDFLVWSLLFDYIFSLKRTPANPSNPSSKHLCYLANLKRLQYHTGDLQLLPESMSFLSEELHLCLPRPQDHLNQNKHNSLRQHTHDHMHLHKSICDVSVCFPCQYLHICMYTQLYVSYLNHTHLHLVEVVHMRSNM